MEKEGVGDGESSLFEPSESESSGESSTIW